MNCWNIFSIYLFNFCINICKTKIVSLSMHFIGIMELRIKRGQKFFCRQPYEHRRKWEGVESILVVLVIGFENCLYHFRVIFVMSFSKASKFFDANFKGFVKTLDLVFKCGETSAKNKLTANIIIWTTSSCVRTNANHGNESDGKEVKSTKIGNVRAKFRRWFPRKLGGKAIRKQKRGGWKWVVLFLWHAREMNDLNIDSSLYCIAFPNDDDDEKIPLN